MTVSIRASLTFGAVALAVCCAGFVDPPAAEEPRKPDPSAHAASAHSATSAGGVCETGAQQSPIDITHVVEARTPGPQPAWKPVRGGWVVNTGETLQVDLDGAGDLKLDGVAYALKQFHFHHPSEHTIDGKSFPLEAHLVHASADGRLAVVGVMFEEGAANPALERVWATAPGRAGKAAVAFEIDPAKLVPAGSPAYRYEGSLTTPPCSEIVAWTVLAQPLTASRGQLAAFAALFPDNHRPVQPLNRRYVLKTGG